MPDIGSVIHWNLGDIHKCGCEGGLSLSVVVKRIDDAPDDEWRQHPGKALSEKDALIADREQEEARDHDEQRDAGAEQRVYPAHSPRAVRVNYTVRSDVLELPGVNLHDHIGGKDTKKVESEMSSVGNCSWHMFDFLIPLCSVALRDWAKLATYYAAEEELRYMHICLLMSNFRVGDNTPAVRQ